MRKLSPDQLRGRLLDVLRQKHHWATPLFNGNKTTKQHLNIHYHQEYVVYIRDFAILLARILGKNPPWEVRRKLAAMIYEEETGCLTLGRPHRELFLEMMMGLGFDRAGFRDVELLSNSRAYREWLDTICQEEDWLVGGTVLTIFVGGTDHDPEDVLYPQPKKTSAEIEDAINKHPLLQYHGLSSSCMDYIRVHEMVEFGCRREAYEMITRHATEPDVQERILIRIDEALRHWSRYQDGIARACGLRIS
jgi:pyrroloquinoline-quinone synthase